MPEALYKDGSTTGVGEDCVWCLCLLTVVKYINFLNIFINQARSPTHTKHSIIHTTLHN